MAAAFMRPCGAMKGDDVLALRISRFENEKNISRNATPCLPKKTFAWAGGSITSNKEAALAKFLARKAAKGQANLNPRRDILNP
jgi:hypothetical protein